MMLKIEVNAYLNKNHRLRSWLRAKAPATPRKGSPALVSIGRGHFRLEATPLRTALVHNA